MQLLRQTMLKTFVDIRAEDNNKKAFQQLNLRPSISSLYGCFMGSSHPLPPEYRYIPPAEEQGDIPLSVRYTDPPAPLHDKAGMQLQEKKTNSKLRMSSCSWHGFVLTDSCFTHKEGSKPREPTILPVQADACRNGIMLAPQQLPDVTCILSYLMNFHESDLHCWVPTLMHHEGLSVDREHVDKKDGSYLHDDDFIGILDSHRSAIYRGDF